MADMGINEIGGQPPDDPLVDFDVREWGSNLTRISDLQEVHRERLEDHYVSLAKLTSKSSTTEGFKRLREYQQSIQAKWANEFERLLQFDRDATLGEIKKIIERQQRKKTESGVPLTKEQRREEKIQESLENVKGILSDEQRERIRNMARLSYKIKQDTGYYTDTNNALYTKLMKGLLKANRKEEDMKRIRETLSEMLHNNGQRDSRTRKLLKKYMGERIANLFTAPIPLSRESNIKIVPEQKAPEKKAHLSVDDIKRAKMVQLLHTMKKESMQKQIDKNKERLQRLYGIAGSSLSEKQKLPWKERFRLFWSETDYEYNFFRVLREWFPQQNPDMEEKPPITSPFDSQGEGIKNMFSIAWNSITKLVHELLPSVAPLIPGTGALVNKIDGAQKVVEKFFKNMTLKAAFNVAGSAGVGGMKLLGKLSKVSIMYFMLSGALSHGALLAMFTVPLLDMYGVRAIQKLSSFLPFYYDVGGFIHKIIDWSDSSKNSKKTTSAKKKDPNKNLPPGYRFLRKEPEYGFNATTKWGKRMYDIAKGNGTENDLDYASEWFKIYNNVANVRSDAEILSQNGYLELLRRDTEMLEMLGKDIDPSDRQKQLNKIKKAANRAIDEAAEGTFTPRDLKDKKQKNKIAGVLASLLMGTTEYEGNENRIPSIDDLYRTYFEEPDAINGILSQINLPGDLQGDEHHMNEAIETARKDAIQTSRMAIRDGIIDYDTIDALRQEKSAKLLKANASISKVHTELGHINDEIAKYAAILSANPGHQQTVKKLKELRELAKNKSAALGALQKELISTTISGKFIAQAQENIVAYMDKYKRIYTRILVNLEEQSKAVDEYIKERKVMAEERKKRAKKEHEAGKKYYKDIEEAARRGGRGAGFALVNAQRGGAVAPRGGALFGGRGNVLGGAGAGRGRGQPNPINPPLDPDADPNAINPPPGPVPFLDPDILPHVDRAWEEQEIENARTILDEPINIRDVFAQLQADTEEEHQMIVQALANGETPAPNLLNYLENADRVRYDETRPLEERRITDILSAGLASFFSGVWKRLFGAGTMIGRLGVAAIYTTVPVLSVLGLSAIGLDRIPGLQSQLMMNFMSNAVMVPLMESVFGESYGQMLTSRETTTKKSMDLSKELLKKKKAYEVSEKKKKERKLKSLREKEKKYEDSLVRAGLVLQRNLKLYGNSPAHVKKVEAARNRYNQEYINMNAYLEETQKKIKTLEAQGFEEKATPDEYLEGFTEKEGEYKKSLRGYSKKLMLLEFARDIPFTMQRISAVLSMMHIMYDPESYGTYTNLEGEERWFYGQQVYAKNIFNQWYDWWMGIEGRTSGLENFGPGKEYRSFTETPEFAAFEEQYFTPEYLSTDRGMTDLSLRTNGLSEDDLYVVYKRWDATKKSSLANVVLGLVMGAVGYMQGNMEYATKSASWGAQYAWDLSTSLFQKNATPEELDVLKIQKQTSDTLLQVFARIVTRMSDVAPNPSALGTGADAVYVGDILDQDPTVKDLLLKLAHEYNIGIRDPNFDHEINTKIFIPLKGSKATDWEYMVAKDVEILRELTLDFNEHTTNQIVDKDKTKFMMMLGKLISITALSIGSSYRTYAEMYDRIVVGATKKALEAIDFKPIVPIREEGSRIFHSNPILLIAKTVLGGSVMSVYDFVAGYGFGASGIPGAGRTTRQHAFSDDVMERIIHGMANPITKPQQTPTSIALRPTSSPNYEMILKRRGADIPIIFLTKLADGLLNQLTYIATLDTKRSDVLAPLAAGYSRSMDIYNYLFHGISAANAPSTFGYRLLSTPTRAPPPSPSPSPSIMSSLGLSPSPSPSIMSSLGLSPSPTPSSTLPPVVSLTPTPTPEVQMAFFNAWKMDHSSTMFGEVLADLFPDMRETQENMQQVQKDFQNMQEQMKQTMENVNTMMTTFQTINNAAITTYEYSKEVVTIATNPVSLCTVATLFFSWRYMPYFRLL